MNIQEILTHWRLLIFIFFCIISFIQLIYFLFIFSRLAFFKNKPRTQSQTHPVSVVICAQDEAANLADNLPGVLVQEYPTTHEVLVVNDNSFDDSKYLLEELHKTFKHLKPIELTQEAKLIPGKKYPLAVGIKTAKHEIILLTDADCIPASEHWISSMQSAFRDDTDIVLGYGAYHKKKGLLNKIIRWETFHTALQYLSYAACKMPYMGVGRNLSYKKTLFFKHKGFAAHHHIPGGDDDLFVNMAATKKNTRINIDPDSFTISKPATTWKQWLRQKRRHYSTGQYYKWCHKMMLGLYALSQFLFYPSLIAAAILFDWKLALGVFGLRMIIQLLIYAKTMKKLNERDLLPWFLFFDIGMMLYYMIFVTTLFRKPRPHWK